MLPRHEQYIKDKFAKAIPAPDPFPHLCIRDVLPPELYREMEDALPSTAEVKRSILKASFMRKPPRRFWEMLRLAPAYFYISPNAKAGTKLDRYAADWHRQFGDYIALVEGLLHERLRVQEPWSSGQRVFFFRPAGWSIAPHVHSSVELTNTIIYFPTPQNTVEQGTLFYRPLAGVDLKPIATTVEYGRGSVEPAAIIPFLPNMLISWINSPASIHGSIEIAGGALRRYLYFISVQKGH